MEKVSYGTFDNFSNRFILFFFVAVIVKNENQTIKTKTSNTEKKEITVSEIIEDKTNSFILIRVRIIIVTKFVY